MLCLRASLSISSDATIRKLGCTTIPVLVQLRLHNGRVDALWIDTIGSREAGPHLLPVQTISCISSRRKASSNIVTLTRMYFNGRHRVIVKWLQTCEPRFSKRFSPLLRPDVEVRKFVTPISEIYYTTFSWGLRLKTREINDFTNICPLGALFIASWVWERPRESHSRTSHGEFSVKHIKRSDEPSRD